MGRDLDYFQKNLKIRCAISLLLSHKRVDPIEKKASKEKRACFRPFSWDSSRENVPDDSP